MRRWMSSVRSWRRFARAADGPLTGFIGVVDLVDIEKNKVRVIVSMFGRETPVELELDQVEVINQ